VVFVLSKSWRAKALSALDLLALKLAALCHDVDHPGWNNDFEVNSSSELALVYNDHSVLENHHASFTFSKLLRKPGCNFLSNLPALEARELRKTTLGAVLATDMALHGKHVDELRIFADKERAPRRPSMDDMDTTETYARAARKCLDARRWAAFSLASFTSGASTSRGSLF